MDISNSEYGIANKTGKIKNLLVDDGDDEGEMRQLHLQIEKANSIIGKGSEVVDIFNPSPTAEGGKDHRTKNTVKHIDGRAAVRHDSQRWRGRRPRSSSNSSDKDHDRMLMLSKKDIERKEDGRSLQSTKKKNAIRDDILSDDPRSSESPGVASNSKIEDEMSTPLYKSETVKATIHSNRMGQVPSPNCRGSSPKWLSGKTSHVDTESNNGKDVSSTCNSVMPQFDGKELATQSPADSETPSMSMQGIGSREDPLPSTPVSSARKQIDSIGRARGRLEYGVNRRGRSPTCVNSPPKDPHDGDSDNDSLCPNSKDIRSSLISFAVEELRLEYFMSAPFMYPQSTSKSGK
ncbi:hypothetical protein QAD02_006073 [Eretmocerus hayati]|uniref:Uncharacterized protein n=1 Tax=Eretmocerus hayati TaxID=131215 RepID=A0ACC2N0Q1_9HYME|nr:hypothetical protein QAD02_006073 [Eretmocerus hayati]